MVEEEPTVIRHEIKLLMRQVALGTSYLHHCGVAYAGYPAGLLSVTRTHSRDLYLHKCNLAVEIPNLGGRPENSVVVALGMPPRCNPAVPRDRQNHTSSLPKYLVIHASLVDCVERGDVCVKVIDLGEGL
jgi:hypothetical protein